MPERHCLISRFGVSHSVFDVEHTEIPGLQVLRPRVFVDERGTFVKTFHEGAFRELGLMPPAEEFFSTSAKGVIRGMHLQVAPAANTKCVACLAGAVLDVVLDLRGDSPALGRTFSRRLGADTREMLFIPEGCAHGFLSLTETSLMFYQSSVVYAPNQDAGVRWDSFGFDWPVAEPILSARDRALPTLAEFAAARG